ncbi:MAG: hypothetical protein ACOYKJ_08550 [Candidatus Howiella sp.]|jgi:chromosome segregation ATPase
MAADGAIRIDVKLDTSKADKELAKLKEKIVKLEEEISSQEAKKSPLVEQAEKLSQELKSARAEAERYKAEWSTGQLGADGDWSNALDKVRQLEAEYARVTAQIDKIDSKLIPMYSTVEKTQSKAGEIAKQTAKSGASTEKMGAATQKASAGMERFSKRLKSVVTSALVFTVVSQVLAKFREWMAKVIKTNDEAKAAGGMLGSKPIGGSVSTGNSLVCLNGRRRPKMKPAPLCQPAEGREFLSFLHL